MKTIKKVIGTALTYYALIYIGNVVAQLFMNLVSRFRHHPGDTEL